MTEPGTTGMTNGNDSPTQVLQEFIACGVIVINSGKRITGFNSEAKALTQLEITHALGEGVDKLPLELQEVIRETFQNGRGIAGRQISLRTAQRLLLLRVSTVPFGTGQEAGMTVVLNDITSLRKLEQNLRRLDRLASIGTLSASMAHEIKNALVAGKTFIELLLEKNEDAELVDIVRREMERIDSIVSQMLRFGASARSGFSGVRINEIIEHSLRLVQPQFRGKSIVLTQALHAQPDALEGDEHQLQQAFVNLLLNSLEAMGPNGTLTIATELVSPSGNGKHISVLIKDSGAGIAPGAMERLFEPFFTTKPTGTGLGLAITRRIVQEHGGVITVESEPGKGAAFRIVLPASKQSA